MKLNKCHCFTPESKVSSCFTVPVLPLRISSKHSVDISFSKRKNLLTAGLRFKSGSADQNIIIISVVYMFCSLDIFRYALAYAISCSETILSQYVRIVGICQELGYLAFLAPSVVSQCSEFSYLATDKNSSLETFFEWVLNDTNETE
jgi:hypothetical protein